MAQPTQQPYWHRTSRVIDDDGAVTRLPLRHLSRHLAPALTVPSVAVDAVRSCHEPPPFPWIGGAIAILENQQQFYFQTCVSQHSFSRFLLAADSWCYSWGRLIDRPPIPNHISVYGHCRSARHIDD